MLGADKDEARAIAAAESVLDDAGVSYEKAYSEFLRQLEKHGDPDKYDGLAALWLKAERAANIALTQGWHNPEGAHCYIWV